MIYKDQLNRTVEIANPTTRIISLVPSQTELLHTLGLEKEVIGITRFCIHPEQWFRKKARVGGTKNINIEKIKSLAPDLIIANKEENLPEQIEVLAKDFPVWVSDVHTLDDALSMIHCLGRITGKTLEAEALLHDITIRFQQLPPTRLIPACYLIWRAPFMTIGGDTFISHMLQYAGFDNVFAGEIRYPQITVAQLQSINCEYVLLSSEPYPFTQKHVAELSAMLPGKKIVLVDGEMFSWYGSRLLSAPEYFNKLKLQLAIS